MTDVTSRPARLRAVLGDACAGALALLLPVWCAGCDRPDVALCTECRRLLRPRVCRRPLTAQIDVFSALDFDGVPARVVRAFKEDGRTALARALGTALAAAAGEAVEATGHDPLIVPVPSSRRAFRRRGYEIAGLLARRAGLSPVPALVSRGTVADQRGLDRRGRAENVAGILRARGVAGVEVIVVDDVVTTGATLREAVRALSDDGARVVSAVTVAATPRHAR